MYPDGTCQEYLNKVVVLFKAHDVSSQKPLKIKQNKNYYFNFYLSKHFFFTSFHIFGKKEKAKHNQVLCFVVVIIKLFLSLD